ncbi:MAG: nucleotidyltransferase domain-containing protein [Candidatus Nezhaarchaeales archaeon]
MFGLNDYIPLINEYLEILKDRYGDRLVSLSVFGSVVRGEAGEGSDVDLLVVIEGLQEDIGSRLREAAEVKRRLKGSEAYKELSSRGLPILVSEVILTPNEVMRHPPILLDVAEEGVTIYDKGGFLEGELSKLKQRLKELGAKRVRGRHGWYWMLKPDIRFGEVLEV